MRPNAARVAKQKPPPTTLGASFVHEAGRRGKREKSGRGLCGDEGEVAGSVGHGLEPVVRDDGVWAIYFNTVLLATLDERDFVFAGNPNVLPMSLDTSVTYLSGCSGGSASDRAASCR